MMGELALLSRVASAFSSPAAHFRKRIPPRQTLTAMERHRERERERYCSISVPDQTKSPFLVVLKENQTEKQKPRHHVSTCEAGGWVFAEGSPGRRRRTAPEGPPVQPERSGKRLQQMAIKNGQKETLIPQRTPNGELRTAPRFVLLAFKRPNSSPIAGVILKRNIGNADRSLPEKYVEKLKGSRTCYCLVPQPSLSCDCGCSEQGLPCLSRWSQLVETKPGKRASQFAVSKGH